jgi:hypothetical protein
VSIFLPVVLATSLVIVVLLAGIISYGIMPATIAAEGSDVFDALSRGYSYVYQRPLQFLGAWGFSLAISALPLAGVFRLLHEFPNLFGPAGRPILEVAGAALSLSCFWTLQSLVYLKMRRLVDETRENQIWDGPIVKEKPTKKLLKRTGQKDASPSATGQPDLPAYVHGIGQVTTPSEEAETEKPPESQAAAAETTGVETKPVDTEREAPPEPVVPKRPRLSFQDTLNIGNAASPYKLLMLLLGGLWAALVLAGGGLAAWGLTPGAGPRLTLESLREAVVDLGEQRPGMLATLAAGVVLLGALGLGRPMKMIARLTAVNAVFGNNLPLRAVWHFARRVRSQGIVAVVLATAGMDLLVVTGLLLLLAFQGACPWREVLMVGGSAVGLLGLGAFGLGAVAVEATREEKRLGALGAFFGNGLETLASAAVNLGLWFRRFMLAASLMWLTWVVACESLSWWGGENVHWVRWGLEGSLQPPAEAGLYRVASAIAGFWFLLVVGLVLMYPISETLRWGTVAFLLARQESEEPRATTLELSDEERQALAVARRTQKKPLSNLLEKAKAAQEQRANRITE